LITNNNYKSLIFNNHKSLIFTCNNYKSLIFIVFFASWTRDGRRCYWEQ